MSVANRISPSCLLESAPAGSCWHLESGTHPIRRGPTWTQPSSGRGGGGGGRPGRGGHPAGSTRGRGDGPYAAGAPRGGPASAFPRRAAREVPSQTLGSWKRPKTRTATTESLGDSPFRPPERVLLGGGRPSGSGRVGGQVRPPLGVPASPGGAGAGAAEPPALPAPARAGQGAPWLPAAGAWRFRGFTPAASCPDVGLGSRRPRWPPRCPATAAHRGGLSREAV